MKGNGEPMRNKATYSDYVIKRKMLKNERRIVVLAARNNLRFEDFTYNDGCYKKKENFKVGTQLYGTTEITITSENFDDIYKIKNKY